MPDKVGNAWRGGTDNGEPMLWGTDADSQDPMMVQGRRLETDAVGREPIVIPYIGAR